MKKYFFLVLPILFLFACQSNDAYKEDIIGKWKVSEWIIGSSQEKKDFLETTFSFEADGNYEVDYSTQKEAGVYRLSGAKLYTTETGKMEKMVKITKLNSDTLSFEMNRAGTLETLILRKGQ